VRRAWDLFRFSPFDISTPEGRSDERYRRTLLSALASLAAKSLSVITALLAVRLTMPYLGPERYGLWMTLGSIFGCLSFADLGLGYSILNVVAEANGKDDRE
jgi:O-antigen/teichoic acid export membrane protein